jgi:tetratricopeptide (TPR) repeat protein
LGLFYSHRSLTAEEYFNKALKIVDCSGESPQAGPILSNLGLLNFSKKQYKLAEDFYKRSLASDEHFFGKNYPGSLSTLESLSHLYKIQNQPLTARETNNNFRR